MAKTSNNTSAKINFSKLIEEVTEDAALNEQEANEIDKKQVGDGKNITSTKGEKEVNRKEERKRSVYRKREMKNEKATEPDEIDKSQMIRTLEQRLSAQRKKTRGYQKSVYFDEDTYEYLLKKQNEYNLRISQVVNEIIRDAKSRDEQ